MKTKEEVLALFQAKYYYLKSIYPQVGSFDKAASSSFYQNPDGGWQMNLENCAAITLRPGYDTPHETHGAICARWYLEGSAFSEQGKPGRLGYPIEDEVILTKFGGDCGRVSSFENASIYWEQKDNSTGIFPCRVFYFTCCKCNTKFALPDPNAFGGCFLTYDESNEFCVKCPECGCGKDHDNFIGPMLLHYERTMVRGDRIYRLAFEDNFSGNAIDSSKWEFCPEGPRQDIGGRWADSEVSVHDGNLWLRARIRQDGVPVSGGIRSRGKFEQVRGYFECRMMFPKATGFWAAFWMMCGDVAKVDGTGVSGSELDIIESGECARRGVNHAIHWDGYGPEHKSVAQFISNRPDLYDGWHVYALEWTKDYYAFFIDGKETLKTVGGGVCEHPGFLKLTTEFGSWAAPIVSEALPDFCRVDWVRVWREI